MTGRGRSPRVGSKPHQAKGSANISRGQLTSVKTRPGSRAAISRSSSGSPSTRTRSLTPVFSSPGRPPKGKPGMRGRQAASADTAAKKTAMNPPASPVVKKREDKKSRSKNRRPKFQDNPSAPEIVEKTELGVEMGLKGAEKLPELENEVDKPPAAENGHLPSDEEEEVDDDSQMEEDNFENKKRPRSDEIKSDLNAEASEEEVETESKKAKLCPTEPEVDAPVLTSTLDEDLQETPNDVTETEDLNTEIDNATVQALPSEIEQEFDENPSDILDNTSQEECAADKTDSPPPSELQETKDTLINGNNVTEPKVVQVSMEALVKILNKHLKRAVNRLSDEIKVESLKKNLEKIVQEIIRTCSESCELENTVEMIVQKFETCGTVVESGSENKVNATLQMDFFQSLDELVSYLTEEVENEFRKSKPVVVQTAITFSKDDERKKETIFSPHKSKENVESQEFRDSRKSTTMVREREEEHELSNKVPEIRVNVEEILHDHCVTQPVNMIMSPGARSDGAIDRDIEDSDGESPVSTSQSSDVVKSLRKIRVKRSRNSSSNPETTDVAQSPSRGDQTPPRLIIPRLLVSASGPNSVESNSSQNSPPPTLYSSLQIEIPEAVRRGPVSSGSQHFTPKISPAAYSRKIEISPTVLSKTDAETAVMAVKVLSPRSDPQPSPPTSRSTVTSPVFKLNGDQPHQQLPAAPQQQPLASLKTVIRVPKTVTNSSSTPTVTTGNASSLTSSAVSNSLENFHKKKNKRKSLAAHFESDGGVDTAEEEEGHEFPFRRKRNRTPVVSDMEYDGKSAEDTDGGKQSPDMKQDEKLTESMVVPEKASSFNIHPERCCSDMCHYCGLKFGMLDTPLHVSQLKTTKSVEFAVEFTGFSRDACLCDKCFRFLDRKAKIKEGGSDKKKEHGQGSNHETSSRDDRIRRCLVRNCNREVSSTVSKKWLIRLKKKLFKRVSLDWERVAKASMKSTFSVCSKHFALVEYYMSCGLCKRKLSVPGICSMGGMTRQQVQELNGLLRDDGIPAGLVENMFLCKLCKTFCGIKLKAVQQPDYLKTQKNTRAFYWDYKSRLLVMLGLEEGDESNDSHQTDQVSSTTKKIHQVSSQSDNPTKITIKTTTLEVATSTPSGSSHHHHHRRRRNKEFHSPSSESRIQVFNNEDFDPTYSKRDNGVNSNSVANHADERGIVEKCSVTIQFDQNTKKLWQDMHYPYGNYTSFFRHLILLEKYWRSGDLILSPNANQKASAYIRSVQNRIEAYEGKHKRSDADLSASTRPDLNVPLISPVSSLPGGTLVESSPPPKAKTPQPDKESTPTGSTILRIPRVPQATMAEENLHQPQPSMPTKIRVRTDLMHLGLMAKPSPNLMTSDEADSTKASQQLSVMASRAVADSASPAKSPVVSNLKQLLSEPPMKQTPLSKISSTVTSAPARGGSLPSTSNFGPQLGKTSLVAAPPSGKATSQVSQSSNSQLFKNSSDSSGSGAIPLTFNNSIAEVLAAASKASKSKEALGLLSAVSGASSTSGNKPDVTITPKPSSGNKLSVCESSLPLDVRSLTRSIWSDTEVSPRPSSKSTFTTTTKTTMIHSASPSGGLSIQQKSPITSSKAHQQHPQQQQQQQQQGSHHPLMDMSKLLQNKSPGVAPHIVAQNTLNIPSGLNQRLNVSKAASGLICSTASISQAQSPLNSGVGIQTVNKKSLNTVLDRLSGLKSTSISKSVSPSTTAPSTLPTVSSSLVQQLQAPPMLSNPGAHRNQGKLSSSTGGVQQPVASVASQLSSLAGIPNSSSLFMGLGGSSGLVGQPMVQFPWAAQQAHQAQQAAQAALLLAGAGMPGMNQAAAAAAMHELMKISLSQQGSQPQQGQSQAGPRIRAPPPLTHMGRPGNSGSGGQQ